MKATGDTIDFASSKRWTWFPILLGVLPKALFKSVAVTT